MSTATAEEPATERSADDDAAADDTAGEANETGENPLVPGRAVTPIMGVTTAAAEAPAADDQAAHPAVVQEAAARSAAEVAAAADAVEAWAAPAAAASDIATAADTAVAFVTPATADAPAASGTSAAEAATWGVTAPTAAASPTGLVPPAVVSAAAAPPTAAAPSATVPPTALPPPPAPTLPARTPPRPQKQRPGRWARRWRLLGLLVLAVIIAVAIVMIVAVHRTSGNSAANSPGGSQQLAAESAARHQAVTWVAGQVGRNFVIACDSVICASLAQQGFPAGNLNVVSPTAPDPYGSELLIASADIRSQFGSKLRAVYAPELIASFGTGSSRIDVRVIAQNGPASFQNAQRTDLSARIHSGSELVSNKRITLARGAAAQLTAGQIDLRLVTALAFLAGQQPLSVLAFGTSAPGGQPGLPLRYCYLAESDAAAHVTGAAYVKALTTGLAGLRSPYTPLSVTQVTLTTGQSALRVEFSAPSWAGLLSY